MPALNVTGLEKVYGNNVTALKGVDLSVAEGDFFALLGPNGAGKTTLIGIVASLINKSAGRVSVFDYDLDVQKEDVKRQLGLVPQEFNFAIFEKVQNVLLQQAGYYGIPRALAHQRAEKYLKHLELWDKRDAQVRELSGGMKRRLLIARALVHEPRLLILDEPTAGVDIEVRRIMWEFFREINAAGTTIILTTHYLEEAESLCKNVAIINKGEIISNTSVNELLGEIQMETFVLLLAEPLAELPHVEGLIFRRVDDKTIEMDVQHEISINDAFARLSQLGIKVASLRNKVNRLEEMFLKLTTQDNNL
ncbi:MAG: ABC transporter ATP-binding protein [Pseudomonadota bacterium]|nr:ABC transporter ATP-binding protein [Pseudomonadota bacterium]